jgi:hypothetical protein
MQAGGGLGDVGPAAVADRRGAVHEVEKGVHGVAGVAGGDELVCEDPRHLSGDGAQ